MSTRNSAGLLSVFQTWTFQAFFGTYLALADDGTYPTHLAELRAVSPPSVAASRRSSKGFLFRARLSGLTSPPQWPGEGPLAGEVRPIYVQ